MGTITATVSLLVFVLVQFLQGFFLNAFLVCSSAGLQGRQYLWIIADCVLLVGWLVALLKYRTSIVRVEFFHAPVLPFGWALYLIFVLLPRLWLWVYTPFDDPECHNKDNMIYGSLVKLIDKLGFHSAPILALLALTMSVMLVAMVTANYAQHGLSSKFSLQYNVGNLVFSVMDGLSLLGIIVKPDDFESMDANMISCPLRPSSAELIRHEVNLSQCIFEKVKDFQLEYDQLDNFVTLQNSSYHDELAINGSFEAFILIIATCSFIVPFLSLWEMKRESSKLKADEKLSKRTWSMVLRHADSKVSLGQMAAREGAKSRPKHFQARLRQTLRAGTWRKRGKTMIRHMAKKRVKKEMAVYDTLERDLKLLQLITTVWTFAFVDLPALCIRIITTFRYQRSLEVLIVKNVLAIFVACVQITATYLQPLYHRARGIRHEETRVTQSRLDLRAIASLASRSDSEIPDSPEKNAVKFLNHSARPASLRCLSPLAQSPASESKEPRHLLKTKNKKERSRVQFNTEPCECDDVMEREQNHPTASTGRATETHVVFI